MPPSGKRVGPRLAAGVATWNIVLGQRRRFRCTGMVSSRRSVDLDNWRTQVRRTFGVFGVLLAAILLMSGICIAQYDRKARASVSTLLCPGPGRGVAFQAQSDLGSVPTGNRPAGQQDHPLKEKRCADVTSVPSAGNSNARWNSIYRLTPAVKSATTAANPISMDSMSARTERKNPMARKSLSKRKVAPERRADPRRVSFSRVFAVGGK